MTQAAIALAIARIATSHTRKQAEQAAASARERDYERKARDDEVIERQYDHQDRADAHERHRFELTRARSVLRREEIWFGLSIALLLVAVVGLGLWIALGIAGWQAAIPSVVSAVVAGALGKHHSSSS